MVVIHFSEPVAEAAGTKRLSTPAKRGNISEIKGALAFPHNIASFDIFAK